MLAVLLGVDTADLRTANKALSKRLESRVWTKEGRICGAATLRDPRHRDWLQCAEHSRKRKRMILAVSVINGGVSACVRVTLAPRSRQQQQGHMGQGLSRHLQGAYTQPTQRLVSWNTYPRDCDVVVDICRGVGLGVAVGEGCGGGNCWVM